MENEIPPSPNHPNYQNKFHGKIKIFCEFQRQCLPGLSVSHGNFMDHFSSPSQERNFRRGENSRLSFLPAPSRGLRHKEGLGKEKGEGLGKEKSLPVPWDELDPAENSQSKERTENSPRSLPSAPVASWVRSWVFYRVFFCLQAQRESAEGGTAPFPADRRDCGSASREISALPGCGEPGLILRDKGSLLKDREIPDWGFPPLFRVSLRDF